MALGSTLTLLALIATACVLGLGKSHFRWALLLPLAPAMILAVDALGRMG